MNDKYNINVEVVTPLAVGAGTGCDWTRGVDYVVKDHKAFVLDLQKAIFNGVNVDKLSTLLTTSDEKGICELLGKHLETSSRYVFDLPAMSANPIKAFLRNQLNDKPVVAGSSLKGAVRSVIFSYLRQEERDNQSVFGNSKDGTDFMRFIQVGDIEMEATKLVNTRLFNLWKDKSEDIWHGGWKHGNHFTSKEYLPMGFNTLYECVLPGMTGKGNIKFSNDGFMAIINNPKLAEKVKYANEKKVLLDEGPEKLFGIVNDATWNYLQKEKEFFDNFQEAENIGAILEGIEDLLDRVPQDSSYCILQMSAGSGFHSITGDWQFDDYLQTGFHNKCVEGKQLKIPRYKSRKIAEYNGRLLPMGFVKLTVI